MNPLQLAWKKLSRIELHSWVVALFALVVAAFALFATLLLRGAATSLELAADRMGADIVVIPADAETEMEGALLMGVPAQFWMPADNVAKLKAIPGVEAVSPQVYLTTLRGASCCSVSEMFMIAYDPETDFTLRPWLEERLPSGLGLNEVIGGAHISATEPNNGIRLYGDLVTLKGNLEPTGAWLDQSLFFTLDTAHNIARISKTQGSEPLVIPPDQVSAVLVKTMPGADSERIAVEILRTLPGVFPIESADLFQSSRMHLSSLLRRVGTAMALIWPLAIVLIGMVYLIAAHERRKDIGVLRALAAEIAGREKAQERIRHLSSFPELNPNPVLEFDAAGRMTYCNAATTAVLARVGQGNNFSLFLPDDMTTILRMLEQKHEARFDREVHVGDAIFSETIQVLPAFNALRVYAFDVTERKQAEESARLARLQMETDKRHLEAVLEALPVGVVITDAEGGILLTNSMDEQIWGSRPVTHDVDDYVQYQAWWADSGEPVEPHEWASAQAVQKGESVFGQMLEIQRFDGGRGFILNSAVPIRDAEGRVTGSAVAVQDITGLRRAERDLRESEEKYRLLFQNMAEGFALYELLYDDQGLPVDWRVLEVNDAYTRHTGIARDFIVGRRISELFPTAIPEYLPCFARVVETQTPTSFETYASAVGRHQHVETFPAGDHRFASIIEDISERRRAEAELQRQATILSRLDDAVIVLDEDWRVTFWNAGAERTYGYRTEEVLGQAAERFPAPTFVGFTREELVRHLSQNGEANVESIRLTKDGRQVWIESRAMMIRDSAGAPGGSIWVDRDITARKEAEEALQRMEEELTLGAQERAALSERQRLARELHDSVSQALYGISLGAHTALTMLDTNREKAREALNFTLSLVSTGLTEMRALIFELRPEALETEGLVAALNRKSAELRARYNIEIALELHDEPSLPLATKEALYRIAQEAMQNAVKHAHCDRLEVRLDCQPDGCCLEVCDNGIGFDPQAAYPGHLGLRSMRERAANVGGTLDISSSPASGTQIRAFVPGPARTSSECW